MTVNYFNVTGCQEPNLPAVDDVTYAVVSKRNKRGNYIDFMIHLAITV